MTSSETTRTERTLTADATFIAPAAMRIVPRSRPPIEDIATTSGMNRPRSPSEPENSAQEKVKRPFTGSRDGMGFLPCPGRAGAVYAIGELRAARRPQFADQSERSP